MFLLVRPKRDSTYYTFTILPKSVPIFHLSVDLLLHQILRIPLGR